MAASNTTQHLKPLFFLIFFFKTLLADPFPSFSFGEFGKDPNFNSKVAIFGNATVVNGGSAVQISGSLRLGAGGVMYKKPIKLVGGNPRQLFSFSTYFVFSMPCDNQDGFAFVMVPPSGFDSDVSENSSTGLSLESEKNKTLVIAVEFRTSRDKKNIGFVKNGVGIYVGSKVSARRARNASSLNMPYGNGEKLQVWIDYQAASRRLEVRLSQFGHVRPSDPFLWHSIDMSKVWGQEEMLVGLSSLKANTSQICLIYSWSFLQRHVPHWIHSEPLDPKALSEKTEESVRLKPRSDCLLRVLAAMIFGAGCGALSAFIMLYLWTIFGNRRPVVPEEYVMQPVDFEYKKVKGVVDKAILDCKKADV